MMQLRDERVLRARNRIEPAAWTAALAGLVLGALSVNGSPAHAEPPPRLAPVSLEDGKPSADPKSATEEDDEASEDDGDDANEESDDEPRDRSQEEDDDDEGSPDEDEDEDEDESGDPSAEDEDPSDEDADEDGKHKPQDAPDEDGKHKPQDAPDEDADPPEDEVPSVPPGYDTESGAAEGAPSHSGDEEADDDPDGEEDEEDGEDPDGADGPPDEDGVPAPPSAQEETPQPPGGEFPDEASGSYPTGTDADQDTEDGAGSDDGEGADDEANEPFEDDFHAPDPDTGPEGRRHVGFFLRLAIGVGYLWAGQDIDSTMRTIRGGGTTFQVAAGTSIIEDLVVHGAITAASAAQPTVEEGSREFETDRFTVGNVMAGLTYYFMPRNVYLGSSVGVSAETDQADAIPDTGVGFALRLQTGKEWWVQEEWGLGLAGKITFHQLQGRNGDPNMGVVTAGLLFSTTYH